MLTNVFFPFLFFFFPLLALLRFYNYMSPTSSKKSNRTEVRHDFCCPWCGMYTGDLAGLLCHVTCSHSHFQFNCGGTVASPEIHVLPRSAPETLDPRASFLYRSSSSTTGVLSEKRIIVSGKHSMKDWGEYDSQSHMYSRDYYHSQTCLPITYSQLDNDSDDEIDE